MIRSRLIAALFCSLTFFSCQRDPAIRKRKYIEGGDRYFRTAKYREARIMYLSALKVDARYGLSYYALGQAELKLNHVGEAIGALRRAVELLPDGPERDDSRVKLADIWLAYLREASFQPRVVDEAAGL